MKKPKSVAINFDKSDKNKNPTSLFQEFGNEEFYMTVSSLFGCTAVVAVSECGAYIVHFWETVMDDEDYARDTGMSVAGAEDALKGIKTTEAEDKHLKRMRSLRIKEPTLRPKMGSFRPRTMRPV